MELLNNHIKPAPYFIEGEKLIAFVLGCDPTAKDKRNDSKTFKYAFGITEDKRYFRGIEENLESIKSGLSRQVYVQNLVDDYLENETSKNIDNWKFQVVQYIPQRKHEFDSVDPSGKLPVFLTSYFLYEVLLNDNLQVLKPATQYNSGFIIDACNNKLGRPLLPLYRHNRYKLAQHIEYLTYLRQFCNSQL